jgi:hypothetical protein
MVTIMKKSMFAFALLIPMFGVLACDDDSSDEALVTRGAELEGELCGAGEVLPKGAQIVATSQNTLLVTQEIYDEAAGIAGGAGKEYSCSCDGAGGGKCYPKIVGNEVYCTSMGCDSCKLNSSSVSSAVAVERLDAQCGSKVVDDELAKGRAHKVEDWASSQGFPQAELSANGREVTAPDGYGLVVEKIGGRSLVYAVPDSLFDAKSGELLKFVGPASDPDNAPLQAAAGGKVKCYCSSAGSCSFTGDRVCADSPGQTCEGSCTVSGKGLTAGKIFEPSP